MARFATSMGERAFLVRIAEAGGAATFEQARGVVLRKSLTLDLATRLKSFGLIADSGGVITLTPRGWVTLITGEYEYPPTTPVADDARKALAIARPAAAALARAVGSAAGGKPVK